MPRYDLADAYSNYFGRFDDATKEVKDAIPLNPKDTDFYSALAAALMGMGAYQDALKAVESAASQGLDSTDLRIVRADVELLQGKTPPPLTTPSWPKDEGDKEAVMLHEAWLDVLSGKMKVARKKIHVVADRMAARGFKESAGKVESDMAVVEAEYGDSRGAEEDLRSALAFSQKANVLINAVLVFSLTGQPSSANGVIAKLKAKFPKDTLVNEVWIPVARAIQAIAKNRPKDGLELLESSRLYELGQTAEYSPIYYRGLGYLRAKDGEAAAIEFQKIIDHRGVSPTSELYPLALMGMARAAATTGDEARSRGYYEQLLSQWKEANPDIPVLQEAKTEYSRLE
jgi:tetratricopeptide (TPR) repeat protein